MPSSPFRDSNVRSDPLTHRPGMTEVNNCLLCWPFERARLAGNASITTGTAKRPLPRTETSTDPLARFQDRLRLPLIAAPMFLVSGVELVTAACRNGVIGAFPTVNCRSTEQLD